MWILFVVWVYFVLKIKKKQKIYYVKMLDIDNPF